MTLTIPEVEALVTERARQMGDGLNLDHVQVFEEPSSGGGEGEGLVVQVSARRLANQLDWTRLRLRFAQAIRDALLERGDNRYPLVQVFGPDEWAGRNA